MHNTCEDSLLATPIILDLVILCELCERIYVRKMDDSENNNFERFHAVLSVLSYLLKAPLVPPGTPVVNALAAQRQVRCLKYFPELRIFIEVKFTGIM
jgi:myo-inositol-1-phosphate synthase